MLNFGNKEFRNLQEQVLKNAQDIEFLKNKPQMRVLVVDELPEVGDPTIIYLVPSDDGEAPNVYEEYIWLEDEERYEMIGTTDIDLSNMVTTDTSQTITGSKTLSARTYIGDKDDNLYLEEGPLGSLDIHSEYIKLGASGVNGEIYVLSDYLVPASSGQFLGTQAERWGIIDSVNIRAQKNVILGETTTAGQGKIIFQNPDVSNQGNWYITSPDQSGLSIMQDTQNTGIKVSRGSVYPLTSAYYTLGSSSYQWKTLYLSHYVSWGNNVLIGKDGSNRFYIAGSDGNTKIKVGTSETLFANKLSPDVSNTYDIGRSGLRWNYAYVNYIVGSDDTVINTSDIARNTESLDNNDLWYSGNLGKTSGQATIDISDEGVGMPPNGVYFFIYGNAQAMFYLNASTIQNAAYYPIRVACPVLIKDGGGTVSGATGNLKIERSGTTLTLTVASTISGAARTEYASDTQGWGFYIYHTGL